MARPKFSSAQSSPLSRVAMILASLMAVATLQAESASAPLVETARSSLSEASDYFDERPYLEPGPALRARRSSQNLHEVRLAYQRERAARGDPAVLPDVRRRQQEALDAMDREASEALIGLPARRHGVSPAKWRPATLLRYVGLHSSVWHLAGNLLLLLLLCTHLEPALGVLRTAGVVLFGTLGASFGYVFSAPEVPNPLIGSSGLLAGLLAVFAWTMRGSRKEGFYTLAVVGGTLWLVVPAWVGVAWSFSYPGSELLGPPAASRMVYWSYAGAAVCALAAHVVPGLLRGRGRETAGLTNTARMSTGSIGLDDALKARAAGREEAAFQQLTVLLRREPEQLDAALLLSDVARCLGRHDEADDAMLRAIRIEAKRDQAVAAVRHWLDLTRREIPRSADPALLIRIASLLRHHEQRGAAVVALREGLERASGSNAAPVATRVARAAQELDPKLAHDAAWRALGSTELSLEERQNLEDLLAVVIPKLPGGEVNRSRAWAREGSAPEAIEIDTPNRVLDVVRATPIELDGEGVQIATHGGNKKRVPYDRIQAVSVGAVQGLASKPVLVVDLALNWRDSREGRLRVIRLRGDQFDPRRVMPAHSPLEAFRGLIRMLLERSEAVPLPDRRSALGLPFASFDGLSLYQHTVLVAESLVVENDS
jgi:membrane associated rhomboid family serine protease